MTIIQYKVKKRWTVETLIDFINQFNAQEFMLGYFNDIADIQDVYESKEFIDDERHIKDYLEIKE
jgi:hypothetical protein